VRASWGDHVGELPLGHGENDAREAVGRVVESGAMHQR
jgi:hypothetical protein